MGYLFALLAGALLGTGGLLITPLEGEVSALVIAGLRNPIGGLCLLLLLQIEAMLHKDRLSLHFSWTRWQWTAAICRALNAVCFSASLLYASTATAFLLCNSTPVMILLWQLLFDRALPSKIQAACALVVTLGGISYFIGDPLHASIEGIVFGVLGGITFAGFFYAQGKVRNQSGVKYIAGGIFLGDFVTPLIAAAGVGLCLLLSLAGVFVPERLYLPIAVPSAGHWELLLMLGVFQTGIAGYFLAKGQARVDPLFMAFLPTLIMIWAPTLTWKFLGETFVNPASLFGFVAVHAGILAAAYFKVREGRKTIA